MPHNTRSTTRCAALATSLALVLVSPLASGDELPLPHSIAEAVAMERANALPLTSFYETPTLSKSAPGGLLRRERFDRYVLPAGARAVRILYHSLDANGHDVASSGVVLVPPGHAPAGGWPVIAWAHGTTGVARACAPSLQKDLAYGEEGLLPMVRAGFAVVAVDYHGLGTIGPHQYVNKLAQARDVVYAIPAARAAEPSLGPRWTVIGHSQGGLAAWAVAELEATRRDPGYVGAISVAGGGNIGGVLSAMSGHSNPVAFYLMYFAYGIRAMSPEFRPEDMLAGHTLATYPDATTNGCWYYGYASVIGHDGETVVVPGWADTSAAQRYFRDAKIGEAPIAGPLLVIGGEADKSVPIDHVRASVRTACAHGLALEYRSYPGLDHDPVMGQTIGDQLAWVRERLAGRAAANSCPLDAKPSP